MTSLDTVKALEGEVLQLYRLVQKMRRELAGVAAADEDGTVLDKAADQLHAISTESEAARTTILGASEKITGVAEELLSQIRFAGARPYFDTLLEQSKLISDSCEVHDAISRRIAGIVRTINAVEGTISALVVTIGDGGVQGVTTTLDEMEEAGAAPTTVK